jgi:PAS domain S-box-containing protein
MIQFTSLSQRLFFGYISATISLIVFLALLEQSDFEALAQFLLSVFALSLVFLVLHLFFYRNFLRPVHHLIQIAKELASNNNSQLRAHKLNDDELGEMVDSFNEMINQIQLREEIIISERDRVAIALEQADDYAQVTLATNKKLELEVQVRKRIESKLTEFQRFLNSIIDSMPSALIAIDEDLIVTQWNQEATVLSGTLSEDAIGSYAYDAFNLLANHTDWIKAVWQENRTRTIHNVEKYIEEQPRHFDIIVYPLKNTNIPSAVIRIDDVTEKIHMEEAIVQSDKVLSLGGMAAGMAHEINNPISAIIQNAQNIERRLATNLDVNVAQAEKSNIDLGALNHYLKERRILSFLTNITQSGLRASNLVSNMLQFSRANDLSMQPCLVIEVLEKAINIAITDDQLHNFKGNFELNFDQDFQAPEAMVLGVFTELEQVLLNLIKNASFAISERKLSSNDIDEGVINIHQFIRNDQCIISVGDNGIGMHSSTRKKIFEPFFTTKDVGSGTGLGLSVSFFIISSHHKGQMQVDSEYGTGTVFEISLPLIKED